MNLDHEGYAARQREFDGLSAHERERLIAVHEAGHAVAHYYHQRIFERMTLGEAGGMVDWGLARFVADAFFDTLRGPREARDNLRRQNEYRVAAAVDMLVAGSVAECRLMRWEPAHLSRTDEVQIDRVLGHVYGVRSAAAWNVRKQDARRRMRALFDRGSVWDAVVALAQRLLDEREITGGEAFAFLRERGVPATGLRDFQRDAPAP